MIAIRAQGLVGVMLVLLGVAVMSNPLAERSPSDRFDHSYRSFGQVLRRHVVGTRVDYAGLLRQRGALDAVVEELGQVERSEFDTWTDHEQIAYWINAYNAFTLQAIVDNYPIDGGWFSFLRMAPRNSIKQIRGVWTKLRWQAAGTAMSLDEIEHETLRVLYDEPRIHFAINCAAVSCPPLRTEPYVGRRLDRQLTLAGRNFLASDTGLQVEGSTLRLSSIFEWYGEDFVDWYGHLVDGSGNAKARAILGVVATYGPAEASRLAQSGDARVRFLGYNWGLNDMKSQYESGDSRKPVALQATSRSDRRSSNSLPTPSF